MKSSDCLDCLKRRAISFQAAAFLSSSSDPFRNQTMKVSISSLFPSSLLCLKCLPPLCFLSLDPLLSSLPLLSGFSSPSCVSDFMYLEQSAAIRGKREEDQQLAFDFWILYQCGVTDARGAYLKNTVNPDARINVTSTNNIWSAGYEADSSLRLIMIFSVILSVPLSHLQSVSTFRL